MEVAQLLRIDNDEQGSLGILVAKRKTWRTIELPWYDNQQQISCIPEGEYECKWHKSNKFGWVYHVTDVAGRTWILTHAGNLAGDVSKGFITHSYGCILLGKTYVRFNGQKGVGASRLALDQFFRHMSQATFQLTVVNAYA